MNGLPLNLSKIEVISLINIISDMDGVLYTSYTPLRLSRPAICLYSKDGKQRTVTEETIKQLLKENKE